MRAVLDTEPDEEGIEREHRAAPDGRGGGGQHDGVGRERKGGAHGYEGSAGGDDEAPPPAPPFTGRTGGRR